MLELPEEVSIFSVRRQAEVAARIVKLTRELAASKLDGEWWEIPASKSIREQELDHHWQWRKVVGKCRNQPVWEAIAIQSTGGDLEGAAIYRVDAKSQLEQGFGAVYVDRLAAAPRNRPWLVASPKYQGIGTTLLLAVIRHSYLLGLGGRVWLTSLPKEQTRDFYRKRGFQMIFEDEDGMIDFELPATSAVKWLKSEGFL
jgi:GNAT superfamily N-acetyltransferase